MKKDIEIPIVKDIHVALILEWNDEFKNNEWNAYLLNDGPTRIDLVFVVSKGYHKDIKTATMRHSMEALESKSFQKIEFVHDEVLKLNNEFFVTYYLEGVLFEKRFLFKKDSVRKEALTQIPLLHQRGILATD